MFEIRHCHYCSVDTHANISALFLIRKLIFVVLRKNRARRWGPVPGQLCVCTPELYTGLYICLVRSMGADPFTVMFSHIAES